MFIKSISYKLSKKELLRKTENELVDIYKKNKDNHIIEILFERFIHLVFASCMKYFKNEDDAQDAAMEIFESLGEKLLKYEVAHFKSWLFITTKNFCLMRLRASKKSESIEFDEKKSQLSVENEAELNLNNEEASFKQLKTCLSMLNAEQKCCVELMYLEGMSYKDIAIQTGYELNKVKSYIQNGKRKLKILLEQHGEDREDI